MRVAQGGVVSWRACIAWHYAAFVFALFCGWDWEAREFPNPTPVDKTVFAVMFSILLQNFQSLLLVVVSNLLTAGVGGGGIMAINGYYIGSFAQIIPWILVFAPFEVAFFCIAGACSMDVSLQLFRWMLSGRAWPSGHFRTSMAWLVVAMAGICLSAALEAVVIHANVN